MKFALKSRSSKRYVLLVAIKIVFPMFDSRAAWSVNYGCMVRAVRGTWNFIRPLATLAQGCASESQLNMDVNLRRLPEYKFSMPKFLVPLAGFMLHPQSADHAATQSKQRKDNLQSSKTYTLRTAGISVQITSDALLYLKFLK